MLVDEVLDGLHRHAGLFGRCLGVVWTLFAVDHDRQVIRGFASQPSCASSRETRAGTRAYTWQPRVRVLTTDVRERACETRKCPPREAVFFSLCGNDL